MDNVFVALMLNNLILSADLADITSGKIEVFTEGKLKSESVYNIFLNNVNENKNLYGTGDLGEVYAISLAQTLGVYSLVTDDIKQNIRQWLAASVVQTEN